MKYYNPADILLQRDEVPLIDVRTPAEFATGHVPGAVNVPLFTDEERVVVGTLYKQVGKDEAVEKGLEFVGPKMAGFVREAKRIADKAKRINVHCWRGGMRSGSMAWLLSTAGLEVGVMKGGYKAYRQYIREDFGRGQRINLLGGMTGSGKTEILHKLADMGEQVLDLEGIAHHRGSAFGALGQGEQPTNEMFENLVWESWKSFDAERVVWVEDESKSIGSVWINDVLFSAMRSGCLIYLNVPFEERAERLMVDYGTFDGEVLKAMIAKITKRMGGNNVKDACMAIDRGEVIEAVRIVLRYYDKAYIYGLSQRPGYVEVGTETGNAEENARLLLSTVL
ncbi:MAG: tRNA 2-selenouridine(34) synthase MnmH [Marinifilaceae bacterium]